VGVESIGVPVPGETMLIVASLYAGGTHKLSIVLIVLVAAAGAIVGDNIGYTVGRHGGWRLLRRYGHRVGVDERRLTLGRYMFLFIRRNIEEWEDRAERALPGPLY